MSTKSTSRWVVLAAWLLSLAAVFLLGMLLGFSVKGGHSPFASGSAGEKPGAEAALVLHELTGKPADAFARGSPEYIDQLQQAFIALKAIPDNQELRYKAGVLADSMDLRELLGVLKGVEQTPQSPVRAHTLAALLQRWGSLDPRSALAYATSPKNEISHEDALLAVLQGWATVSPREAWAWVVQTQASAGSTATRAATVVLEVAQKDPEMAATLAAQAPTPQVRGAAMQALLYQQLNRVPPQQAARWLTDIPAGDALDQSAGYLAGEWARFAPADAAAWAAGRDANGGRVNAVEATARSWSQSNPKAAATWVANLPSGPARARAAEAVADAWLDQDGAADLAQWLNGVAASPDYDSAIATLARQTAVRDPATGFSWAATIQDGNLREATALLIGRDWMLRSPDAARSAIGASGIDEPTKRMLLGQPQAAAPSLPAQPAASAKPQGVVIQAPVPEPPPEPAPQPEPQVIEEQVDTPGVTVEQLDAQGIPHYTDDQGNIYYEQEYPADQAPPPDQAPQQTQAQPDGQ